jgi:outer membrane protein assembly factor BamB
VGSGSAELQLGFLPLVPGWQEANHACRAACAGNGTKRRVPTAGGLVFTGNPKRACFALDAMTGQALWHFQTGGQIWANPVTFLVDGKQHVVMRTRGYFVFAL